MLMPLRRLSLAALTLLLAGCGKDGTSGGSLATARFTFVHALPDTGNVDVRVNSTLTGPLTAIPFGTATAYQAIPVGAVTFSVQSSPSTSADVPRAFSNLSGIQLSGGMSVTLIAAGRVRDTAGTNAPAVTPYIDDPSAPATGQSRVRVINASPDAGAVDFYVTPFGAARTNTPQIAGVDYHSAVTRSYSTGSYAVLVTALSDPATALATGSLVLVDGGAQTIVVRGFAGPLPSGVASDRSVSITTMVNRTP
jgi:Domain of unknown function (DUF4397)